MNEPIARTQQEYQILTVGSDSLLSHWVHRSFRQQRGESSRLEHDAAEPDGVSGGHCHEDFAGATEGRCRAAL